MDLKRKISDDGDSNVVENNPKRRKMQEELVKEKVNVGQDWANLPWLALSPIFEYSTSSDRCNLLKVCRGWADLSDVKSIWQTIDINIPDSRYGPSGGYPETLIALEHSFVLKRAEINFQQGVSQITPIVLSEMQVFLQILSQFSHLNSVAFHGSGYRLASDTSEYIPDEVCNLIYRFLSEQNELTSVDFRYCFFNKSQAENILYLVCGCNRVKLDNLDLTGFFRDQSNADYRLFYSGVLGVKKLIIDYCDTYENIMIHFASSMKNEGIVNRNILLQSIRLSCGISSDITLKGISSEDWLIIKQTCPNLSLDISYRRYTDSGFKMYLRKNMPLRNLEVFAETTCASDELDCATFFGYLAGCGFNACLESLDVVWRQPTIHFAEEFAKFTMICTKLERIRISVRNPVPNLRTVFESWAVRKPEAMLAAHITVTNVVTAEDFNDLMNLADDYGSRMQKQRMRLVLKPERAI